MQLHKSHQLHDNVMICVILCSFFPFCKYLSQGSTHSWPWKIGAGRWEKARFPPLKYSLPISFAELLWSKQIEFLCSDFKCGASGTEMNGSVLKHIWHHEIFCTSPEWALCLHKKIPETPAGCHGRQTFNLNRSGGTFGPPDVVGLNSHDPIAIIKMAGTDGNWCPTHHRGQTLPGRLL